MRRGVTPVGTIGRVSEVGEAAGGIHFDLVPQGAFSLAAANARFGGWVDGTAEQAGSETDRADAAVLMAFPVEGWDASAAVVVRQGADGNVTGDVFTTDADNGRAAERAWRQAVAVLSLDVDGSGFATVGEADPVIGGLQARYPGLRPVLFHSPYEAAASFLLGHRISIAQGRAIRRRIAEERGAAIPTPAGVGHAFPSPAVLLDSSVLPSVPAQKVERLHAAARAAIDGTLDRDRLRALPEADALADLGRLPGVGPFFAQGILMRGAGLVDAVTDDEVTRQAVQRAYGLAAPPARPQLLEISERWRPYRMWATVLLHVWFRSEGAVSLRTRRD